MTLDYKKKVKCNKIADFLIKNQNLLKNLMLFGLTKLYFLSSHLPLLQKAPTGLLKNAIKNRNFQNFKLVVPLKRACVKRPFIVD